MFTTSDQAVGRPYHSFALFAGNYAVPQIKAEPAKNSSFWIMKTSIKHKYVKVDRFWLPAENHSESNIRLGGRATLTIEYKGYEVLAALPALQNKVIGASHQSEVPDSP